jgi:phosphoglycolate phosphatase
MSSLSGCTIAFDLDGTLVDSAPDIHRTLNHIMGEVGLPPASGADVRNFIGHGSRGLIVRACAVHGVINDDDRLDELVEMFGEIYGADIARGTRAFPGVETALKALQASGALLCVCTNKHTDLAKKLLAALDLAPWFGSIVGADAVALRKPHPEHFIAAVRAARGDPARAMMVGDSASDVGTARGADAPVALYGHGYTDTAPELLGADAVFSHFNELPDLAARLLQCHPMPRT